MKALVVVVVGLLVCRVAQASEYTFAVAPAAQAMSLVSGSGEVQSTIVGPNLKSQCPAGRILITMDTVRPPQAGTVIGRNLDNPTTPDIQSTFDPDPDAAHDVFGTNDDDILTFPNGDVLLVWGYHSFAPLTPKPPWFDKTFGANTGPGVRRGSVVYRSKDCGASFQFLTRIDPAKLGDGLCANPQPMKPPSPTQYANGGSDGQLAQIVGGNAYLTMDCVGFLQDKTKPGFVLGTTPVNRTYVLESKDEGQTWPVTGFMPLAAWRTGIATVPGNDVALGAFNLLTFGHKANSSFTFNTAAVAAPTAFGWTGYSQLNPGPLIKAINGTRVISTSLLARVPGSTSLALAYPSTFTDSHHLSSFGYALALYDPTTKSIAEVTPIEPTVHGPGHFLMHMVAIDPGNGPILLYWYDIDGNTQKGSIRGRFIYELGSYSNDFEIASTFDTKFAWYGDYHTAGGYAPAGISSKLSETFHYYPMWVQSDGKAHYGEVNVTRTTTLTVGHLPNKNIVLIPKWIPAPPPVELEKIRQSLPRVEDDDVLLPTHVAVPKSEHPAR